MNNLEELKTSWKQTEASHTAIHELFIDLVNKNTWLKAYRDFVDENVVGFGERSFAWLFNLIIKEMPTNFSMLETGVFRGSTLGLTAGLASQYNKNCTCYGVSPLNGIGTGWERDYTEEVKYFFTHFTNNDVNQKLILIKELSEAPAAIEQATKLGPYDIVYLDGGHEEKHITNDILKYAPMVKQNGYLLIDDCCNNFSMKFGYFQGIDIVTEVTERYLPYNKISTLSTGEQFEFVGSVIHIRLYKRIK